MQITDPIADMLTRIRNAGVAKQNGCNVFAVVQNLPAGVVQKMQHNAAQR